MITSTKNDFVKYIDKLQNGNKFRNEEDIFVVEGIRMVSEAPQDKLVKVIISETFMAGNREWVCKICASGELEIVSDAVYKHISDTQSPQGIMALIRQQHYGLEDVMGAGNQQPLLVILENIQNPGNLGTILRSAEAAGATGVIMSSDCTDIYNPKTIRGSMGSLFRMPFLRVKELPGFIKDLQNEKGITCYAAALTGSVDYSMPDYQKGCGFIIGNEGNGLREETISAAAGAVRIPMEGQVESLNAGIAASIFLYEAHRQRSEKCPSGRKSGTEY